MLEKAKLLYLFMNKFYFQLFSNSSSRNFIMSSFQNEKFYYYISIRGN